MLIPLGVNVIQHQIYHKQVNKLCDCSYLFPHLCFNAFTLTRNSREIFELCLDVLMTVSQAHNAKNDNEDNEGVKREVILIRTDDANNIVNGTR